YDAGADDPDGDTVRFALVAGPDRMEVDRESGRVTWSPAEGERGTRVVALRVEDGRSGGAEQRFVLTGGEGPPHRPPVITSAPVVAAAAGAPYAYDVAAADPDGDTLTFALAEQSRPVAIINPSFEAQPFDDWGYSENALTGWVITG